MTNLPIPNLPPTNLPTEHPAYPLARILVQQLSPGCVRLDIAGSLRRGKENPGDIELVAVPILCEFTLAESMFDLPAQTVAVNRLDDALHELYQRGEWILAINPETGKPSRNGERWKKLLHQPTGILCDLFITGSRKWAYTFVIRTGPADFGHALVTRALNLKMFFDECLLHAHPPVILQVKGRPEVQPCPLGEACPQIVELATEQDFFDALHLAFIQPSERSHADPASLWRVSKIAT